MRNLRNPLATVAVVGGLLAAGIGVGVQPAFAAAKVNGTGAISCTITSGSVKFKPGLTATPTPTVVKVKINVSCTGANGAMTGSGKSTFNSPGGISALAGCGTSAFATTIKWKGGTQKLNSTTISISGTYSNGSYFDAPTTASDGASCTPPVAAGTCTVAGSFAGETCANHVLIGTIKTSKGAVKEVDFAPGGSSTIS